MAMNYNERTGQWEDGSPYSDGSAFTYDERSGMWSSPVSTQPTISPLTAADIKNQVPYRLDVSNPWNPQFITDYSAQVPTDPNAYYNQLASDLSVQAFKESAINGDPSRYTTLLDSIKAVNPQAYYTGQIGLLSQQAGQYAVGKPGQEAQFNDQIKALLPEAQKAGVTPEQINSIYEGGYSQGGQTMQTINANKKEQGSSLTPLVQGLKFIGPAALGMYGLDMALTAGLGAAYGAGTGMSTVGLGSGLGGAAALDAGLAAGAGSIGAGAAGAAGGFGFATPSLATGLELGTTAGTTAGTIGGYGSIAAPSLAGGLELGAGGGLLAGTGGLTAASIPSLTAGLEVGTGSALTGTTAGLFGGNAATTTGTKAMEELFGPTYQELGYTGLEAGQMGPTYADLGFTGLNTEAAISAADAAAAAQAGISTTQLASLAKQYGLPALKAILGTATKAGAAGSTGSTLGGLLGAAGNYALSASQLGQLRDTYGQNVAAQQAATQTAQQQAAFTPVGMTTAFGSSNFQFDPTTGKLTSAGYTPTSQVAGQVQNLFGLGAQALPTTADTQAVQQQYISQQQGLLAPGREQQLAQLQNRQYQRGTTGLATGGTMAGYAPNAQGLMATNPEMAAYYNAQAQQDAQLAANAPTYAQNLLNQQIATGTGLFGAANTLEGYAQQPLSLSSSLGQAGATAGAKSGYYGLLGNQSALATQLQGQQANIYGTGQAIGSAVNPLLTAGSNLISEWLK